MHSHMPLSDSTLDTDTTCLICAVITLSLRKPLVQLQSINSHAFCFLNKYLDDLLLEFEARILKRLSMLPRLEFPDLAAYKDLRIAYDVFRPNFDSGYLLIF